MASRSWLLSGNRRGRRVFSLLALSVGVALLVAATTVGVASSATRKAGASSDLRGGTLRVDQSAGTFDTLDPQLGYVSNDWELLNATQLLLLNYPDRAGNAGERLVPEAAKAFPTISKHGTVYTYHLRPGLRFSDGSPVTAAAFQRAFERILSPKMFAQYGIYDGVDTDLVGGQAFAGTGKYGGKRTTKHISGIRADGLTLTIHLTHPVPWFESLLAMQWFGAVKPNMPYTTNNTGILKYPSAGPYYIATAKPHAGLVVLKRNRYYHGLRPAYPDRIVIHSLTDPNKSLLQIEKNQVDYDLSGVPVADTTTLAQKYGYPSNKQSQFHVATTSCVEWETFNDARPPTNNVNVRKALEYALGRTAIVNLRSAPYTATPTDQVLVPGLAGYKKLDLYPNSPNIEEAEQIGGSALKNAAPLDIGYFAGSPLDTSEAELEQSEIQQIGLTVKLTPFPESGPFETPYSQYNLFHSGWCPDYFDPADGILPFVSQNGGVFFHNSSFTKQADHAASLTGRTRANAYTALDRLLMTKYAPVFPLDVRNFDYLTSERVHNIIFSHYLGGPILNAISVR